MMPWWYGYWNPWVAGWPRYGVPYGGYRYLPWAPLPKEQEMAMLEDQARALESDLDSVRKRLEELKK